jgi:MSHA biogenesis protein MshO
MIELVIVMVIVGVLADVLSRLVSAPMRSYIAQQRRGELVDNANIAIDRITLETHLALPNSIRVTADNLSVEFLRTVDGGRYRTSKGGILGGDVLDFDSGSDVTFDVIGQLKDHCLDAKMTGGLASDCANGNAYCLVIGNTGMAGSNAYQGDNIATVQSCQDDVTVDLVEGADGSDRITFFNTTFSSGTGAFPLKPSSHRFQIVDSPVTFRCDVGAGTLKRYDGYAIAAAQPDPPGSTPSLLLDNVTACSFTYNPLQDALIFRIETEKDGELVTLLQQIKVNNDT